MTVGRGANSRVLLPMQIAAVPRDGVPQPVAIAEVQQVMRSRHGLRLDDPDDFDLVTQDAILQLWDRISQATFLALIVISSIALMVGGIGVMAIMSISVTERTREIGVRKGARRQAHGDSLPVPDGGRDSDLARRPARHRARRRPWLGGARRLGLPHLAPVVVVRDRPRLLRGSWRLFRHVSRGQSLPPGPHRSALR